MPIYEYKCVSCGFRFEQRKRFDEAEEAFCPRCGGKASRMLFPPPVIYKGEGFYTTDSRTGQTETQNIRGGGLEEEEVGVEGEDLGSKIAFVEIENARLLLKTLLGEQEGIRAAIKELDFLSHYIILENPREGI